MSDESNQSEKPSSPPSILESLAAAKPQDPQTPLADSLLLGFDTETTGVGPTDAIVSASLVLRDPSKGYAGDRTADWVINPHRHISAGASSVNGFTDDYLAAHGREPAEALDEIASLIATAQDKRIPLLAYNAPFDVQMLQLGLRHWNLAGLGARIKGLDLLVVDPLILDRHFSKRHGRRNLSSTSAFYGVSPHGSFHDASADTTAAIDLLAPMFRLYPQAGRIPLSGLMAQERDMHAQWARSFNDWQVSHGRRPISDEWM